MAAVVHGLILEVHTTLLLVAFNNIVTTLMQNSKSRALNFLILEGA